MQATPVPESFAAKRSHLLQVTLVVGLVITLLLPWAIYLGQMAQRLAIVKKSLDLPGGTITVESEVGVGTMFTLTLPLNQGKQDNSG